MTPDAAVMACSLSSWDGKAHNCRWCNAGFRWPRRRWCSDACLTNWRENHVWDYARDAAKQRDGHRCQDCLDVPADKPGQLEVDHLQPVNGTRTVSCLHHQENLRTRCQQHHLERHRQAVAARGN